MPDEPEAVQEPVETTGEPAVEVDPFDNAEQATFDRAYVEKLRQEAASNRVSAKEMRERYASFEGYDDGDRQLWSQLAEELQNDPRTAAANFKTISENILSSFEDGEEPTTAAVEEVAGDFLTEDKLKSFMQNYEREQSIDREAQGMLSKARELGYDDGTDEQILLLTIASQKNIGIEDAHKAFENISQARYDKYIAEQAKHPIAPNDGTAVSGETELALDDRSVKARAMARIEKALGPEQLF